MAEIRNLTRNGETFYPLTCTDAVVDRDGNPLEIVNDIFDISEYNASGTPPTLAKYSTLALALAAVPQSKQKGGMTIRYVQTSDNNYIQYMYISTSTAVADFTNVHNWQKVNVEKEVRQLESVIVNSLKLEIGTISSSTGEEGTALRKARTINYIMAPCRVQTSSEYKIVGLYRYSVQPDGTITFVSYGDIDGDDCSLINQEYIYRIVFSKIDTSALTEDELDDICSSYKCGYNSLGEFLDAVGVHDISPVFERGYYINSSGVKASSSSSVECSDYISCSGCRIIKTSVSTRISGVYIAFYNRDKTLISTYRNDSKKPDYIQTIPVPNNAALVRFSNCYGDIESPWFKFYGTKIPTDDLMFSEAYSEKGSPIYNEEGAVQSVNIVWSDGTDGVLTYNNWSSTDFMYRGYEVTYGQKKLVQPAVTVANGVITNVPERIITTI